MEVDSKGRALTGHYEPLDARVASPRVWDSAASERALRLPTISDGHYHELARSVDYYKSGGGWLWGPGSSTMYRRSVLELARYSRPGSDVDAGSRQFPQSPLSRVSAGPLSSSSRCRPTGSTAPTTTTNARR